MKQIVLVIGGIYGMLSIILGAFGAHAFKNLLTPDKLDSFEVGVRSEERRVGKECRTRWSPYQ